MLPARPAGHVLSLLILVLLAPSAAAARQTASPEVPAQASSLGGRVLDPSGAVVPNAAVIARAQTGEILTTVTDGRGRYVFPALAPGRLEITADGAGFAPHFLEFTVSPGEPGRLDITLEIGTLSEAVQVVPDRLLAGSEAVRRIPGSVDVLDLVLLENTRVLTTAEALRKVSGVHVRDEEGLGLRPNVGLRGLNPTRSSRVLLLEDGIPLTYAPYGDNAAYYHPPIERFDRVELLKGSGQIAYGPMTVGGVINYVTPTPPGSPSGSLLAAAGARGYRTLQGGWGTTLGATGLHIDFMRKQGDGARENISSKVHDVHGKTVTRLTDRQVVTLRGSYYGEDSNVTYSGLREDEYRANPRQNPFENDFFYLDRYGASATHAFTITSSLVATTNLYTSRFQRHWWRQSSNSSQRPNDAADPACGGMANLNTACGNEGRLREYLVWGVEPRVRAVSRLGRFGNETDLGVRVHVEDQERRQENGDTPRARSGNVVENNERRNVAFSGFVQNRFLLGPWSVTPGVRVERVQYERTNRLLDITGQTEIVEVIPGVGAAFSPRGEYTVFAGVHRGFTPPRTEDVINNVTGGAVDLDPERSWNAEIGVRARVVPGLFVDAAFFRMDYQNQVIPATLAGGVGSLLTNAGETLHQGVELTARVESGTLLATRHNLYVRTAFTWLPVARFEGVRFSSMPGHGQTSVTGNRLPYAPAHLVTAGIGFTHAGGLDVNAETVFTGKQFGDDLNTIVASPDGQRGLLPRYMLWNAALNYPAFRHAAVFVAVKNVFDRTVIVDRSRGILPGAPRTIQMGMRVRF